MKGAQLCFASFLRVNFELGLKGLSRTKTASFLASLKYFIRVVPGCSCLGVPPGLSMSEKII